jgi:hypothetical protein
MTYREDFTLPAELMERVRKQASDILLGFALAGLRPGAGGGLPGPNAPGGIPALPLGRR